MAGSGGLALPKADMDGWGTDCGADALISTVYTLLGDFCCAVRLNVFEAGLYAMLYFLGF